jgi:hypothetical protein
MTPFSENYDEGSFALRFLHFSYIPVSLMPRPKMFCLASLTSRMEFSRGDARRGFSSGTNHLTSDLTGSRQLSTMENFFKEG